jgi:peptide/nickel transport system permease protein
MSAQSPTSETGIETQSRLRGILHELRSSPTATIGMGIIGLLVVLAVFATIDDLVFDRALITALHADPHAMDNFSPYEAPSAEHPLGTDQYGRDILVRLIYGSRIALAIGIIAVGISFTGGVIVGAVAAYFGGYVDDVLMRLAEVLYAVPALILALVFMAVFGPNIYNLFFAFGIIGVPGYARVMRSEVFSIREEQYVDAARAAGLPTWKILFREVIPNGFAAVVVQATLSMGGVIIGAAALSFLGFGVQPPTASWGRMLSDARQAMLIAPWVAAAPGAMIFLTVMGFNMLGDGLRDAMDPKISLSVTEWTEADLERFEWAEEDDAVSAPGPAADPQSGGDD